MMSVLWLDVSQEN